MTDELLSRIRTEFEAWTRGEGRGSPVYYIPDLLVEIERLRQDLGKLLGVAQTYMNADGQVRGEAFRDLAGTVAFMLHPELDPYGWPAVAAKLQNQLEATRSESV